jgi:hypothetical protein
MVRACITIGFGWVGLIAGSHDLVPARAHELAPCLGAGFLPHHDEGVGFGLGGGGLGDWFRVFFRMS